MIDVDQLNLRAKRSLSVLQNEGKRQRIASTGESEEEPLRRARERRAKTPQQTLPHCAFDLTW
jgi:hypothetical protein